MRKSFHQHMCELLADYSECRSDQYDQRRDAFEHATPEQQAAIRLALWDVIDEHVDGYPCDGCGATVFEHPTVNGEQCATCVEQEVTVVTAARDDVRRVGS